MDAIQYLLIAIVLAVGALVSAVFDDELITVVVFFATSGVLLCYIAEQVRSVLDEEDRKPGPRRWIGP
jgi:uncharacterized membrane protein